MIRARFAVAAVVLLAGLAPAAQAQQGRRAPTPEELAERERRFQEELRAPRPIEAANSVWIDEMTWMEVRDAIAEGKRTAIIATGGIEQNGPYLITGKHNVVLRGACEGIARQLGDALCAPVVAFVPEGDIEPTKTGHMRYPGTISLREETFRMLLDDMASSLKAHGFTDIVFIGDSGGNQDGMEAVATALNQRWTDGSRAHFVPEFYRYADVFAWMDRELGIKEGKNDGLHDDFVITSIMLAADPTTVRYDQRVKAGKASINGLSLEPRERTQEIGRKLLGFRVDQTVQAIRAAKARGRASQ